MAKTGTTKLGLVDLSSDVPPVEADWYKVRSGWPELRCTPGRGICWPRVVLTWIPFTWAHVLLSAIDCLVFSRVFAIDYLHFSHATPMPPMLPVGPLMPPLPPPPPVHASSSQDWYYCRSSCYVISLWVRLMFCQLYPHPITPMPTQCPQLQASGGQEWY